MDCEFISTALFAGEPIDCRCLILAAEFYNLSRQQTQEMADDFTQWIEDFVREKFVIRIMVGGKWVGKAKRLHNLKTTLDAQMGWAYGMEGMALSPVVHSLKTFNGYFQNVHRGLYRSMHIQRGVSIDYRDFWNNLFAEKMDSYQIKQNILRIFREESKYLLSTYDLPDVQAYMTCTPYKKKPDLYYGSFAIHLSSACAGQVLSEISNEFSLFARYLSEKYVKLNARVMLQPNIGPFCNPYMSLFSTLTHVDGSHEENNCTKNEWYSTYYIPGVEWFNIISPLAKTHLSEIPFAQPTIAAERLSGGGLAIGSTKSILAFDVRDALELKKLVYPALFPGMRTISLRTLFQDEIAQKSMSVFPRSNWALIPVFEEEVDVVYTNLVFSKNMNFGNKSE